MMPIPAHQRANHERTDDALMTLKGLSTCLDVLRSDSPAPDPTSDAALAQAVVLDLMIKKIDEAQNLHSLEWIGIGGSDPSKTAEEVALALGEQAAPNGEGA